MMEVMIAITLLSIIGAVLYEGLTSAIDAKEQIEVLSDRSDEIRISLNRMATELSMAYLSDHYNREERRSKTLFKEDRDGEGDRLVFTSFSHVRRVRDAKESDQNVLTYWVDSDPEDGRHTALLRKEKTRIDENTGEDVMSEADAHTDVLCTGVKDLTFDYWNENDKEWIEDWDSESLEANGKLPPRVRIRMRVQLDETREQVFETQAEIQLRVPIKLSAN